MATPKIPSSLLKGNKNIQNKRVYSFDHDSFLFLQKLARDYAGLNLQSNKEGTVYNRLVKRLRELDLPDFKTYCNLLLESEDEKAEYISLVANPLTSFFREKHHYQYLQYNILPELIAQKRKIRIWSAGCSTGEEAYSIAITVCQSVQNLHNYDIKILATDINPNSLDIAAEGIYDTDCIEHLSFDIKKSYFLAGRGKNEGLVKVSDSVRKLVSFHYLNLVEEWPMRIPFDLIFCRNVLIYFTKDLSNLILKRFDDALAPGGYLVLGYTESSFQLPKYYKTVAKTIYKKSLVK